MNIAHLRYALEVERTRSISKAAENLYMGQPNLSRAIRELEESLGVTLFSRTSKGMQPTPQGEEFLHRARGIVAKLDELETMFAPGRQDEQRFSISVPRASYIACAFTEFVKGLDPGKQTELYYLETNAQTAVDNLLQGGYRLGIVRYQKAFEQYFKAMFREKGLSAEPVMEFSYLALLSEQDPLAARDTLALRDLESYTELAHADPFVPSLSLREARGAELSGDIKKHVFVFERGSQMDLLSRVPGTFMWVSPVPERLLKRYGLVQRPCADNGKLYRDMLICKKGYVLTELDRQFLAEVEAIKQRL